MDEKMMPKPRRDPKEQRKTADLIPLPKSPTECGEDAEGNMPLLMVGFMEEEYPPIEESRKKKRPLMQTPTSAKNADEVSVQRGPLANGKEQGKNPMGSGAEAQTDVSNNGSSVATRQTVEMKATCHASQPASSSGSGNETLLGSVTKPPLHIQLPARSRMCGNWLRGNCRHGVKCCFKHEIGTDTGAAGDKPAARSAQEAAAAAPAMAGQGPLLPLAANSGADDEPPRKQQRVPEGPVIWSISAPKGKWKTAVCAACSGVIALAALRLKHTKAHGRVYHPSCVAATGCQLTISKEGVDETVWQGMMKELEGRVKETQIHAPATTVPQDTIMEEIVKLDDLIAMQDVKVDGEDEALLNEDIRGISWKKVSKARPTKIDVPEGIRTEYAQILTILLGRAFDAADKGNEEEADNQFKAFMMTITKIVEEDPGERGGRRGRNKQIKTAAAKLGYVRDGRWDLLLMEEEEPHQRKRRSAKCPTDLSRDVAEIEACIAAGELTKAANNVH